MTNIHELIESLTSQAHRYTRVGYDQRSLFFCKDGTIGAGSARRERFWELRYDGSETGLDILDAERVLTCRLHHEADGVWRGRWERFERMPIELAPVCRTPKARALLIRQADGDYTELLRLTHALHEGYADRHGIDFWSVRGAPQLERASSWSKALLIRQALQLHYELVVWLDADTLIVDPSVDLREAMSEFEIVGMCKHPLPWGGRPWHYNAGVLFVRNGEPARQFFREVWEAGPLNHPWQEQYRMLELDQRSPGFVQAIDDRWNATVGCNPSPEPIIKAWHGYGAGRFAAMQRELERLAAADE